MTYDEALGVALILTTADGGCPSCVRALIGEMCKRFPEHPWFEMVRKRMGFDGEDLDIINEDEYWERRNSAG